MRREIVSNAAYSRMRDRHGPGKNQQERFPLESSPEPQRFLQRIVQDTANAAPSRNAMLPGSLEVLQGSIEKRLQSMTRHNELRLRDETDPHAALRQYKSPVKAHLPRQEPVDEEHAIHEQLSPIHEDKNDLLDENHRSDIWQASSSASNNIVTLPPLPPEVVSKHEQARRRKPKASRSRKHLKPVYGPFMVKPNPAMFHAERPAAPQTIQSAYSARVRKENSRSILMHKERAEQQYTNTLHHKINLGIGNREVSMSRIPVENGKSETDLRTLVHADGAVFCPAWPLVNRQYGWQSYMQLAHAVKKNPSMIEPLEDFQIQNFINKFDHRKTSLERGIDPVEPIKLVIADDAGDCKQG